MCGRRLAPGGHPAAPEARHRHGPLRPRRAAGATDRRWSASCRTSRPRIPTPRLRSGRSSAFATRLRPTRATRATSRTAPPRCACPTSRFDAARCGIALYGHLAVRRRPGDDGLEPALSWRSELALVKRLERGREHRLRPPFVAGQATWIGIVPVGYGDGFRRDLTGTAVRVGGEPRKVVGTISMDSFAVELPGELPAGTPVTLLGHGVSAEAHAQRRGDDRVRARLRDRVEPGARAPHGGRCVSSPRELLRGRGGVGGRRRRSGRAARTAGRRPRRRLQRARAGGARRTRGATAARRVSALRAARRRGVSPWTDGRTVDFLPLQGGSIEADLGTRDFALNAIAEPLAGGEPIDPFDGRGDVERRAIRARVAGRLRATTRCGCCARYGSRTSSTSGIDQETERSLREQAALVARPGGRADPR